MPALPKSFLTAALVASLTAPAFAQDAAAPGAPATPEAPATPAPLAAPTPLVSQRSANDEDVAVTGTSGRSVFAGGRQVDVAVTAPDVFAAGETVDVRGVVLDNLFGGGQIVTVSGPVGGDAFLAGETLNLSADVAGDVYALSESLTIPAGVTVAGNVYYAGADFELQGAIGGSLLAATANTDIDGSVGGDVKLETASLDVGSAASIAGELAYSGPSEATIEDGASVGSVDYTFKAAEEWNWEGAEDATDGWGAGWAIYSLLAAMLIGGALIGLLPRAVTVPAQRLVDDAPVSLGVGFAVLLGVPVLAGFLALFVLPIPLSLLAMAVYVPALVFARFVAAYALGGWVIERAGKVPTALGAMAAGLLLLHLAYAIPLVGALVKLAATVLGLGALFAVARNAVRGEPALD